MRLYAGVLTSLLGLTPVSAALADTPPSPAEIARRLRPTPKPAQRRGLAHGTARPYVAARRALARGEASQALVALRDASGNLFADREALVRGDALLALGESGAARKAFLRALEAAQIPSIARAAVKGLAQTHISENNPRSAAAYLEVLLARASRSRKPALQLELARAWRRADPKKAAALAADLALEHPARSEGRAAEALLEALAKRGVPRPVPSLEARIDRAEALVEARALDKGEAALGRLPAKHPRIRYLRARIAERRGQGERADTGYTALLGPRTPDPVAVDALGRLARRRLRADENDQAQKHYDALSARTPGTREAIKAEYMAGWIAYDAGRYADARARMLRYAAAHRRVRNRDEAIWFAGWSSYLAEDFGSARKAFLRLLDEHETSALVPHVHYWLGRIAHRRKELATAKSAYLAVLERAPLGYYALWASHRLKRLGEDVPPLAPPAALEPPASVEDALAALGPGRPITIDRAILLQREDRPGEAVAELEASRPSLRKMAGAQKVSVADLLFRLGAHHLAFRTAQGLTGSGRNLAEGNLDAWRAWRHLYPRAFPDEMAGAAVHEVPPDIVWAIMRTESHYRPWVRSRVGARGLMQLMPATARRIGKVAEGGRRHAARYRKPDSNVWLGAWYLGALIKRYGGQLVPAVGAYNGGPRAMDRWLDEYDGAPLDEFVERIPYRETRRYVRRVVETWAAYQQLYEGRRPTLPERIEKVVVASSKASF